MADQVERLQSELKKLEDVGARHDVEHTRYQEEKAAAETARRKAEEALARAETARQRAEEEKAAADKARMAALANADVLRKDAEREKKRAQELEQKLRDAASGAQLGGSTAPMAAVAGTDGVSADAEQRIRALEEELSKVATELALAQQSATSSSGLGELKRRAEDAYTGINDALSELRTNILMAKELVEQHGDAVPDTDAVRALNEAIQVSMDRTEDAKGLLRGLREVVEN
jgi:chromosome segregation ATPase